MRRLLASFLLPLALAALPAGEVPSGQADFVLVDKSDRTLTLYRAGEVLKTYTGVQLSKVPEGRKRFAGDKRVPEGSYTIDARNPDSAYHLGLHISYPNAADAAYAERHGRSPGGQIFIHGQPNDWLSGRKPGDWTDGCIAVGNEEIKELWTAVPDGTPIEIRP